MVEKLNFFGITDEDIKCAGWLHDTIDDTSTDYDKLEEDSGQVVVTKDNSVISMSGEIAAKAAKVSLIAT